MSRKRWWIKIARVGKKKDEMQSATGRLLRSKIKFIILIVRIVSHLYTYFKL